MAKRKQKLVKIEPKITIEDVVNNYHVYKAEFYLHSANQTPTSQRKAQELAVLLQQASILRGEHKTATAYGVMNVGLQAANLIEPEYQNLVKGALTGLLGICEYFFIDE